MYKTIFLFLFILFPAIAFTQTYKDSLLQSREYYKRGLLTGSHALKPTDTAYLRFYEPDPTYRVNAVFRRLVDGRPFLASTIHGGTSPAVKIYGYLYFNLKGAPLTLKVYRLMTKPEDNTNASIRLFIPFADGTNYKTTFRGGRYMDIAADDLATGSVIIDFNKCYNPHTAYEKNYPYLILPEANSLLVDIRAGEKIFGHNPGY